MDIEVGTEFLGYRIEELIGRGGMGVVYRAYDLRLKRTVALKLVASELALDEGFQARFARETELAMSLEHPNVVPIHDAGDVGSRLYLAMRLVEGTDLGALLREAAPLEPARALAICGQVAKALDAAHANGLVHRDVKPSNILLDRNEHVYLADFGLTRRLEEHGAQAGDGRSVGTPSYLAPEHIEGGPIDGRADVYSLGCVLYECLTGGTPFARGSRLAVVWAHMEEEPPSASEHQSELPQSVDQVIRRAMAKAPEERYPTCSALVADAEAAFGLKRRRRGAMLVAFATLVALVTATAAAGVLLRRDGGAPTVTPASLVKIDPGSNDIVDVIPVGRNPGEVEIVGDYVFVASVDDATLSRIDSRTGVLRNSGRYSADGSIARQGDRWLWVASASRHEVARVDVESLNLSVSLPLPESSDGAYIGVGGGALWAGTFEPPLVERWSLRTLQRERKYPLESGYRTDWPIGVGYGFGAAWIGLGAPANELLRIDGESGRQTRIPVGGFARQPVAGFGSIWVPAWDDKKVYRVDPSTRRVRNTIDVGNMPMGLAIGAGSVWVTNHCDGTLSRIDPATDTVVETIDIGYHPQWLAFGNGYVWVGVSGDVFFETCLLAHPGRGP